MLLCSITREQLLHFLPKGGEGAEIGVAKGEFSRAILDVVKPRRLHLIDPWEHQAREDYSTDGNNVADDEQEARYRAVLTRFAAEIDAGQVVPHRAYSQDAAADFADSELDWAYIDGLHSYEGCRSDLRHYAQKVKPAGFIMGHDYTNNLSAQRMKFGVVEAVNEFVAAEGFIFIALTQETFPTYVLARSLELPAVKALMAALIYHLPNVIQLRDYPASGVLRHDVIQVGDRCKAVMSF